MCQFHIGTVSFVHRLTLITTNKLVQICVYMYTHTHTYTYKLVQTCACVCVCVCAHIYIYVCVCVCVCVFVYIIRIENYSHNCFESDYHKKTQSKFERILLINSVA